MQELSLSDFCPGELRDMESELLSEGCLGLRNNDVTLAIQRTDRSEEMGMLQK